MLGSEAHALVLLWNMLPREGLQLICWCHFIKHPLGQVTCSCCASCPTCREFKQTALVLWRNTAIFLGETGTIGPLLARFQALMRFLEEGGPASPAATSAAAFLASDSLEGAHSRGWPPGYLLTPDLTTITTQVEAAREVLLVAEALTASCE
jgi:hypothetical protein